MRHGHGAVTVLSGLVGVVGVLTLAQCGGGGSGSEGPTAAEAADAAPDSPRIAETEHDTGAQGEGMPDAGTTDSGTSDAPAPNTTPITGLTAGVWTWVPFPRAVCRDGSSTGIGVNLGTSNHLMIFLEGGGACFNSATCGGNPSSFSETDFNSRVATSLDEVSVKTGILNRTNAANPVKDWSFVYVPYCTGDFHAGKNVTPVRGVSGPPQHFVGYVNVGLYLDRLVPTFHNATQVLLAGLSAGGFGAALNYAHVAEAFGATPVTLLDDSGPFMEDPYFATCLQDNVRTLWGLDRTVLPDCEGDCTTPGSFYLNYVKHVTKTYPNVGIGLADSTDDNMIIYGWATNACTGSAALTGATFTAGLLDIRAQLAFQSNFVEFIFPGTDHTTIQSAAFYTRISGSQAGAADGGRLLDGSEGTLMTDWVAGLLSGAATNTGPDCTPKTCADFPAGMCGQQSDACGGLTVTCGANDAGGLCPSGQSCGGGGPGVCGGVSLP
jgi:Pectinacetylesterase